MPKNGRQSFSSGEAVSAIARGILCKSSVHALAPPPSVIKASSGESVTSGADQHLQALAFESGLLLALRPYSQRAGLDFHSLAVESGLLLTSRFLRQYVCLSFQALAIESALLRRSTKRPIAARTSFSSSRCRERIAPLARVCEAMDILSFSSSHHRERIAPTRKASPRSARHRFSSSRLRERNATLRLPAELHRGRIATLSDVGVCQPCQIYKLSPSRADCYNA
jgi:hypothetical protein